MPYRLTIHKIDTTELNQLTTNLASNGADAEAIAQNQADYF